MVQDEQAERAWKLVGLVPLIDAQAKWSGRHHEALLLLTSAAEDFDRSRQDVTTDN